MWSGQTPVDLQIKEVIDHQKTDQLTLVASDTASVSEKEGPSTKRISSCNSDTDLSEGVYEPLSDGRKQKGLEPEAMSSKELQTWMEPERGENKTLMNSYLMTKAKDSENEEERVIVKSESQEIQRVEDREIGKGVVETPKEGKFKGNKFDRFTK